MEVGHILVILADSESKDTGDQRFWLGKIQKIDFDNTDDGHVDKESVKIKVQWYRSNKEFGKYTIMGLREKFREDDVTLDSCIYWLKVPAGFDVWLFKLIE
jgi:hypothetical protein